MMRSWVMKVTRRSRSGVETMVAKEVCWGLRRSFAKRSSSARAKSLSSAYEQNGQRTRGSWDLTSASLANRSFSFAKLSSPSCSSYSARLTKDSETQPLHSSLPSIMGAMHLRVQSCVSILRAQPWSYKAALTACRMHRKQM